MRERERERERERQRDTQRYIDVEGERRATWRVYLRFLSNANTPSIIIFAAIKIPTTAPIIGRMAIFTCLKKYAHKINIQYISLNAIFKVKVSYLLYTLVPHSQHGNHLNSSL